MLVPMELSRIVFNEIAEQQYIFLTEIEGDRTFPILIGLFEAHSIDRQVKISEENPPPPRPLTHDLLKNVIEELGGVPQDVIVHELSDRTFYALIRIDKDGELIEIDSRPSDAIALSVHYDPPLPIFVDDSILDEVA